MVQTPLEKQLDPRALPSVEKPLSELDLTPDELMKLSGSAHDAVWLRFYQQGCRLINLM